MGFSQGRSGADHPHPIASESCQPSFMQGSVLKLLDLIYSFPSCLSRVVENFLFCIILLTERMERWVERMCVCVSPPPYGRKKKNKTKRRKLTTEARKEINVEKVAVMDKYLQCVKTKKIYF